MRKLSLITLTVYSSMESQSPSSLKKTSTTSTRLWPLSAMVDTSPRFPLLGGLWCKFMGGGARPRGRVRPPPRPPCQGPGFGPVRKFVTSPWHHVIGTGSTCPGHAMDGVGLPPAPSTMAVYGRTSSLKAASEGSSPSTASKTQSFEIPESRRLTPGHGYGMVWVWTSPRGSQPRPLPLRWDITTSAARTISRS